MTKNKNIGFICSSESYGGLEINVVRLAGWMGERGWNSILYCLEGSPMAATGQENGLSIEFIKKNWKYFDLTGARALNKKLKKNEVSVVIVSHKRDISLVSLMKMFCYKDLIMLHQQQMQIGVNKKDFMHTLTYSQIDAWLAPLPWLAKQVVERTRIDKNKVHVVPLGLEINKMKTNHHKESARDHLKLNQDALFLGVLGRLESGKRQHFCIQALAEISKSNAQVALLIVGEPTRHEGNDYEIYLKKLVMDLKLEGRVSFRPFMKEVDIFFKAIDLFVLPSEGETYGMVTLEAMAMGVPVIATNTGGTPEILKNGDLGTLFEPRDIAQFSNLVLELLENSDEMKKKVARAKEEVETKYTHHQQCRQTEAIIETL